MGLGLQHCQVGLIINTLPKALLKSRHVNANYHDQDYMNVSVLIEFSLKTGVFISNIIKSPHNHYAVDVY